MAMYVAITIPMCLVTMVVVDAIMAITMVVVVVINQKY